MTQPKRPLKVFLCHAHADRDTVRVLYTRLTNDDVDAWLDKAKLLPGQDWELEIKKAVREADVVVVCLSKQFNQRGFRQKEVRLALDTAMEMPEGEIFIIPARLEECDNLESLRKWHWVDLFETEGYEMLLRALRRRADNIGATLQIKKSWLPNISTSHQTQKDKMKSQTIAQIETNEPNKIRKPAQKLTVRKLFSNTLLLFWGIFVFGTIALMWKPFFQMIAPAAEEKIPQVAATSTYTETVATSILEPTIMPTPLPTEITDAKGITMRLVPAGEFTMGSNEGGSNEQPAHQVYLDAYYMDKYEVTNAAYERCVDAGACPPPKQSRSYSRTAYYGNPEFDEFPVIYVDWNMAKTYCEWRGASLPTEAQWEKSARGIDGRSFPWGEGINCNKANYLNCKGDTTLVGSYEDGKSPYGIYDLAGNVWEWTADWYSETYYQNSPSLNPLGPDFGQYRVLRGGSWDNVAGYSSSETRFYYYTPNLFDHHIGFRCAMEATP